MSKPQMMLKWADEERAQQIDRATAAATIWKNRRARPELRIKVRRMHGETYISSDFLGVACCIFKARGL